MVAEQTTPSFVRREVVLAEQVRATDHDGHRRLPSPCAGRALALPLLVLAVLVFALNSLNAVRHPALSPVDELGHVDYLFAGSELTVPRAADQLRQETMREATCRGNDRGPYPASCTAPFFEAPAFAWKGYSPAGNHTPYYYVVTGLAARALRAVTPIDSLVTAGRILGAAWFVLGAALTLLIGLELGVRRWPMVVALTAIASVPAMLGATSRVNPDATSLAGGALVALMVVRWSDRRAPTWTVLGGSIMCCALDPTNAVALIAATAYLAIDAGWKFRRARDLSEVRRAAFGFVLLVAGLVIAIVSWRIVLATAGSVASTGSPQELAHYVRNLPPSRLLGPESVWALFPPFSGYAAPELLTPLLLTCLSGVTYLSYAALLGLALRPTNRLARFTGGTVAGLVLGGPVLVLQNYVLLHWYFPIGSRYGLSVTPGVVLALAAFAHRRLAMAALAVMTAGLFTFSTVRLF